jgi:hypothetical protein
MPDLPKPTTTTTNSTGMGYDAAVVGAGSRWPYLCISREVMPPGSADGSHPMKVARAKVQPNAPDHRNRQMVPSVGCLLLLLLCLLLAMAIGRWRIPLQTPRRKAR